MVEGIERTNHGICHGRVRFCYSIGLNRQEPKRGRFCPDAPIQIALAD
jgi:hypothetical protein